MAATGLRGALAGCAGLRVRMRVGLVHFAVPMPPGFAAAVIRWAASSWTGPAGLGIAVVLLAVSAVASVAAYRRRSL